MNLDEFGLSEDDLAVRASIRAFAERKIQPYAREIDEQERFPIEALRGLADQGYVGLMVPVEYGGGGGTILQYCIVMEEISRACAATGATFMTQIHGMLPILLMGDQEQKERWLPDVVAGRQLTALAITEPEAGSDLAAMRTTAQRVDGGYRIDGHKIFITSGSQASLISLFARTDPNDRHGGISMFAVEVPDPGITFGSPLKKMGIRGSDTAEIFFNGVEVSEDHRLGPEGAGFRTALGALGDARVSVAAQAVGIAARAYEIAAGYAHQREQFGRPIYEFQAVQLALMDMYMAVTSARQMLYQVARFIDSGARTEYAVEASMAKVYCSDIAMRVSTRAVDVLGGYGYMREYEVERLMRDAKITQIYDGTNDINRISMAKQLKNRAAAKR